MVLDCDRAVLSALRDAGYSCSGSPVDSTDVQETILVRPASGIRWERYMDGSRTGEVTVNVTVVRESEAEAEQVAFAIEDILEGADLPSPTGAYALTRSEVTCPRAVTWDKSGYYAWTLDVHMLVERN